MNKQDNQNNSNMIKKIYFFLQTKVGFLVLIFIIYIILYGFDTNIGFNTGRFFHNFLPSLIIMWFLGKKYKWSKRQIIVNTILMGAVWKFTIDFWFAFKYYLASNIGEKPQYSTFEQILRYPVYYFIIKPITGK